ncbi:hypothetical protein GGX14DRAFT_573810 [Mycena pura]|uniref:Uncharacterized protein n=1 Tax=Mycena pura TaxID=153505 RepID=A0AAD6UY50_9AGAR|nr:hypothetical protein GGX14DRAFT_573810 [Mycena pura]
MDQHEAAFLTAGAGLDDRIAFLDHLRSFQLPVHVGHWEERTASSLYTMPTTKPVQLQPSSIAEKHLVWAKEIRDLIQDIAWTQSIAEDIHDKLGRNAVEIGHALELSSWCAAEESYDGDIKAIKRLAQNLVSDELQPLVKVWLPLAEKEANEIVIPALQGFLKKLGANSGNRTCTSCSFKGMLNAIDDLLREPATPGSSALREETKNFKKLEAEICELERKLAETNHCFSVVALNALELVVRTTVDKVDFECAKRLVESCHRTVKATLSAQGCREKLNIKREELQMSQERKWQLEKVDERSIEISRDASALSQRIRNISESSALKALTDSSISRAVKDDLERYIKLLSGAGQENPEERKEAVQCFLRARTVYQEIQAALKVLIVEH